jgi:drug/metabolite transporter (DMT)-like permease
VTGFLAQPTAVLIALAAAFCFALANVLQQRVASRLSATTAFDASVLLRLARKPLWLVGFAAVIASISLQAAALGMGRLVVIEPVLATSLLAALAMSAWADRRRMRSAEWAAAIATFAGLAIFLVASQPSGGKQTAATFQLALAAAAAFCFAGIATLIAIRLGPVRRALLLGIGGGVAAGVTDALTKTVAFLAGDHHLGVFADPRLYLLAFVGLTAYTLQQNGYRAAGLAAFLPAFAVLDPVVGSILGMSIYHERLGGGPARIAVEGLAAIVATWGIARLASSGAPTQAVPVDKPRRWRSRAAKLAASAAVVELALPAAVVEIAIPATTIEVAMPAPAADQLPGQIPPISSAAD